MSHFKSKQTEYLSQNFTNLNLSGDEIAYQEFDSCTFKGCDFSEATFKKCTFIDCSFINCNLSNMKIAYSKYLDVVFDDCKMIGIDWTKASWPSFDLCSPIKFYNCIINDSYFFGLNLNEIVIESCKAHFVDFRSANFSDADFNNSDFSNSQFSQTNLTGADFSEAINYRINVFHNDIKKAKFSRYEAVNLLEGLGIELVD